MIANDMRPGPPNGAMLICPVNGCTWRHERTRPQPMIGESMKAAARDAAAEDDSACRTHLAGHPVDDFVRTISELRTELGPRKIG